MRTYILLQDAPDLKKGAVLEERRAEIIYFQCITPQFRKFPEDPEVAYSTDTVTKNPEWFMEVKQIFVPIKKKKGAK